MKFNDGENVKRFVLIVEDELINREILGNMLGDEYHVLYAVNGIEALETLRENETMVSVVLLDLMMPEMNGFEVIEVMRNDDILKHIPIIVLTSEQDAEVKTLQLGAADFIKKPYNMPEVIKARIARAIELSEDRNFIKSTEKDALTDLYTKTYFYKYAEMIDKYHPELKTDAVILNIEHFHLVNEIYGRQFGDKVLITIAGTIRNFLTDTEGLACRSEGDTFYIYISHQSSYDPLIDKIQDELSTLSQTLHVRLREECIPRWSILSAWRSVFQTPTLPATLFVATICDMWPTMICHSESIRFLKSIWSVIFTKVSNRSSSSCCISQNMM